MDLSLPHSEPNSRANTGSFNNSSFEEDWGPKMATSINTITNVPEQNLQNLMNSFREIDEADIVTAVNDGKGTFTVESTIFDKALAAGGSIIAIDGKMSTFGGPDDTGVRPDEGLSLFEPADVTANPDLFLATQPAGTSGLARRLNPQAKYLACRWNLAITPKSYLKSKATLVTVTNPANNKSEKARPADTGPAIETGRVADLSPGLAQALGLNTDDACHVEIPTPAGAQLPSTEAGVAVGVNLAAIDSTIFPHDMIRQLVVMTSTNDTTYWVVNQIGLQEGGQSLLRHSGANTEILLSDTTVFPILASAQVPAVVVAELNKAAPDLAPSPAGPAGSPPASDAEVNAKMFATAQAFVSHETSSVPGTEGGNLACAWAVNQVARLALGKPISTDGQGGNGLSTDGLFDVLTAHHLKLNSASDAKPGTIIVAPTQGANHGHVGVVGATAGGVNDTLVYSNSSHLKKFAQNYSIGSFTSLYTGKKGLKVLFFALKQDQFG